MFEHGEPPQTRPEDEDDDVLTPLGPAASGPAPSLLALRTFRESLAGTLTALDDAARIDQVRALEELKAAAAAAQARLSVGFDASQRAEQAAAGTPRRRLGRGIGEQVAAARRDAPRKGGQHLGLAKALRSVLPHTMRALELGRITEWRATLILREIACLSEQNQREVDRRLAADTDAVHGWGDRRFAGEAHIHALELDNAALTERARKAAGGRRVTIRPAPDGMSYLTALLPLTQGVAVYATLHKYANSQRAAGDERGRGQVMADTLIERITQQPATAPVPVEIRLVITDRTLLAGGSEPAYLPGHGSIPADYARGMVRDAIRYRQETDTGTAAGRGGGTAAEPGRHADASSTPGTSGGTNSRYHGAGDAHAGDDQDRFDGVDGYPPGAAAQDCITETHPPGGHDTDQQKPDDPPGTPDEQKRAADQKQGAKAYAWLRAVYTHPSTGALIAMSSRRRTAPAGLADLIDTRDQTCRTPWCDAPIRHRDHITGAASGSPTSVEEMQGLCEACNYTKEAHGWHANCVPGPRHTVRTTTPTGHTYESRAPRLPGAPPEYALDDYSYVEGVLIDLVHAA